MKIFEKVKAENGRRKIYFCGVKIASYRRSHTHTPIDFEFQLIKLPYFQSSINCGNINGRMTERCLELAIAKYWLENIPVAEDVFEIGAVSPYYFPRAVNDICDPYDASPFVNHKCTMFDLDLKGKNVLSISTIEHIATGDYGLDINQKESAVNGFEKIAREAKTCLITFPIAYNKELDQYFCQRKFEELNIKNLSVMLYIREDETNCFEEVKDFNKIKETKYTKWANGVIVIIKG